MIKRYIGHLTISVASSWCQELSISTTGNVQKLLNPTVLPPTLTSTLGVRIQHYLVSINSQSPLCGTVNPEILRNYLTDPIFLYRLTSRTSIDFLQNRLPTYLHGIHLITRWLVSSSLLRKGSYIFKIKLT